MNALLLNYLPLVVFLAVALVIGLALLIAPFLIAPPNSRSRKTFRL